MFISIIVVTRNTSIAVRTLHNLLNLNNLGVGQKNVQIEINFVKDDPFEKSKAIMKKMKSSDRILFIDYGVSLDIESIKKIFEPFQQGCNCLVFPCVTEGIDWDMFKKKVENDVNEPSTQMGLNFDTEVSSKINGDIYKVTKTNPRAWILDSKQVWRTLKGKKNEAVKIPAQSHEMFEKFFEKGVKMCAFIDAKVSVTYQHECLSNILQAAGVNKD